MLSHSYSFPNEKSLNLTPVHIKEMLSERFHLQRRDYQLNNRFQLFQSDRQSSPITPSGDEGDNLLQFVRKSGSQKTKSLNFHQQRNWNEEFQTLRESYLKELTKVDVKSSSSSRNLIMYNRQLKLLNVLQKDFENEATRTAKQIINELFRREKKIKVDDEISGIMRGRKYFSNGIYYKLVVGNELENSEFLATFGSVENLLKLTTNELTGNMIIQYSLLSIENELPSIDINKKIAIPLQVMIEYLGYRIIATSFLPINNKTIVYGSHTSNEVTKYHSMIKLISNQLNLKYHQIIVPSIPNLNISIYTSAELECHIGTDDRIYIIDSARLMPPLPLRDCDLDSRLFRYEFLKNYPPLSSDSLSNWSINKSEDEKEIKVAFDHLIKENIIQAINLFISSSNTMPMDLVDIKTTLHNAGVNMKFLGIVRELMPINRFKIYFLHEMVARVFIRLIRSEWRKLSDPSQYYNVLLLLLNNLFNDPNRNNQSPILWAKLKESLISHYPSSLSKQEEESSDLRSIISLPVLLFRIRRSNLFTIKFRVMKSLLSTLYEKITYCEIIRDDILYIYAVTRTSSFYSQYQCGIVLNNILDQLQLFEEENKNSIPEKDIIQLMSNCLTHFHRANSIFSDEKILNQWGNAHLIMGCLKKEFLEPDYLAINSPNWKIAHILLAADKFYRSLLVSYSADAACNLGNCAIQLANQFILQVKHENSPEKIKKDWKTIVYCYIFFLKYILHVKIVSPNHSRASSLFTVQHLVFTQLLSQIYNESIETHLTKKYLAKVNQIVDGINRLNSKISNENSLNEYLSLFQQWKGNLAFLTINNNNFNDSNFDDWFSQFPHFAHLTTYWFREYLESIFNKNNLRNDQLIIQRENNDLLGVEEDPTMIVYSSWC